MFHPATWLRASRKPRTRFIIFKNDVSPTNELFHSFLFPLAWILPNESKRERKKGKEETRFRWKFIAWLRNPVSCACVYACVYDFNNNERERGVKATTARSWRALLYGVRACYAWCEQRKGATKHDSFPANQIRAISRARVCVSTHTHTHTLLPWTRYLMTHALIVKLLFRVD